MPIFPARHVKERSARRAAGSQGQMTKTVLFVQHANTDYYPTTYNASRLLAGEGFHVIVCCRGDRQVVIPEYGRGIEVLRVGSTGGGVRSVRDFFRLSWVAWRSARRTAACVVVGFDIYGGVIAYLISRLTKIPFFYHCYDVFSASEGIGRFTRALKPLERRAAFAATRVVLPSESKAERFEAEVGAGFERTIVANAPPLQPRKRTDVLRRMLAERGAPFEYVVYYHGSIAADKGLLQVLRSMVRWPATSSFVLVGPAYDAAFMARFMEAARNLGLTSRVMRLDMMPLTELLDLTRSADVGVFVPEPDSIINVYSGAAVVKLNDYLACALPFVTSRIPPLEALVLTTGAGIVVDPQDTASMGDEVAALLTDTRRRATMADNAYRAHRESYNLERQYATTLETIRTICG